jgi:hypothetical protein
VEKCYATVASDFLVFLASTRFDFSLSCLISKEGLDEMGRIRKTTLTIGEEKIEKLTVFTKEHKEILKKLGLEEGLFHM